MDTTIKICQDINPTNWLPLSHHLLMSFTKFTGSHCSGNNGSDSSSFMGRTKRVVIATGINSVLTSVLLWVLLPVSPNEVYCIAAC